MTLRKICYHYHEAWSVVDFFKFFLFPWKFYFETWDVVQESKCLCSVSAGTWLLMDILFKWG